MLIDFQLSTMTRGPPQILPFIVQNLELYTPGRGANAGIPMVTKPKSSWVKGLVALVAGGQGGQVAAAQQAATVPVPAIVRQHFRPNRGVMVIPFLRNLRSVFERSHEFGVPIVDLEVDWWWPSDRDREGNTNHINEAIAHFTSLAEFLVYVSTH